MDNGVPSSIVVLISYTRYSEQPHRPIDLVADWEKLNLGKVFIIDWEIPLIRISMENSEKYLEYKTDVVEVEIYILFGLDKIKSSSSTSIK